jgi:hypothetical protein
VKLTYKTIDEAIKAHEGSSLLRLTPLVGVGEQRPVLVSKYVSDVLEPPWPMGRQGSRYALARQVVDEYILGNFITVAQKPFDKDSTAIMARVDPVREEAWDFRCLDPNPGIRIFGCFAKRNFFIALNWDFRENLVNGGFDDAVRNCKTQWHQFFGYLQPHSGSSLDDYFSRPFRAV